MRVDITSKPVGSFFGGRERSSVSMKCPVCGRPGLLTRESRRGVRVSRSICHAFELRLDHANEPECVWDEPCIERFSE